MKYGELARNVLMSIGEYSANGVLISDSTNKDYLLAMQDATNDSLTQIVTISKSKIKLYELAQKNPVNTLGQKWEEFKLDGEAIYTSSKGRAYSIQVGGSCTIYLEEEITGAWTVKDTIVHTHNAGEGYVLYKGNVTKTDKTNPLRIRITSDYDIPYRWVALFNEYLESPVSYEPYVGYNLPSDLYQFNTVSLMESDGTYEEYPSNLYEQSGKTLYLKYEERGEFKIEYYAYPELLTVDLDNVRSNDDVELDLLEEYTTALINDVAGKLKANIDKKYAVGDRFANISVGAANSAIADKQRKSIERPIKRRF